MVFIFSGTALGQRFLEYYTRKKYVGKKIEGAIVNGKLTCQI